MQELTNGVVGVNSSLPRDSRADNTPMFLFDGEQIRDPKVAPGFFGGSEPLLYCSNARRNYPTKIGTIDTTLMD